LAIKTAQSKVEVVGILLELGLSEEGFVDRFPVLAKLTQGLPDVPDGTAPPV
jgi:hypothetical protein